MILASALVLLAQQSEARTTHLDHVAIVVNDDIVRMREILRELQREARRRPLTTERERAILLNRVTSQFVEDLLRRQAANENPNTTGSPNPAYSALLSIKSERQANVQALTARKAALNADLSSMMASQANEPTVAAEANRISRDYTVLKDKYDELLKDREEMRLRGQVENERSSFKFEVIDPPTTPRAPSAPNRLLLLLGVLFAGIAAGVGAAFAIGQLKSTFSTTSGLERAIELPVLGAISQTLTDAARELQRKRMKQFYGASAALGGLCVALLAIEFVQRGMVA